MITVKNISKSFDSKKVLDNISTVIPDSGIFAVSGVSGSGKTTFMRILAGLETPDSGTIEGLDGKKISVMFQKDRLLPWHSALDNVAVVCDKEKAKEWLKKVELSAAAGKKPSELSGGMCRRVALARALAFEGDILFLDEPFKGLDIELRDRMAELIKEFAKTKPVILITHDRWEASLATDELRI
ncbi:MAG: ABC transporter ATP-binding protein [Clostridia bacterium]|nr:ABC transporter ATP-binding protein [Clostridia bacterium]